MPVKVLMPALSPTMTEGKLTKWLKSEGDNVEAGDVIAEIETDKATMEVEAVDEGKLAKIVVAEGTENVPVNNIIAIIAEEDDDDSTIEAALNDNTVMASNPYPTALPEGEGISEEKKKPSTSRERVEQVKPAEGEGANNRLFASPLARRLAKEKGIELSQVQGSGPHGRVVKSDIEGYKVRPQVTAPAVAPSVAVPSSPVATSLPKGIDAKQIADAFDMPYRLEENSGMRKVIANRLLESKLTVPHYYLSADCELDELMTARKQINDTADGLFKLSVNDFIIKAVALALKKVPEANVSWGDEAMLHYERADISVAVATEGGLITPIIKDADMKSLKEISAEIKDLAGRARENKLKPAEYQGGTFTVSNLGMYGIKEFSAIINPPQAGILAIGAGTRRAIVKNGEVVPAMVMTCTGSFDHRAIDGAVGAQFLAAFKEFIENPLTVLA